MQAAWNQALQIVAAERPNLTLWDWPTIRSRGRDRQRTRQHIHLPGAPQYRQRSALMADDVTARLGVSRACRHRGRASGAAAHRSSINRSDRSRVIDTRQTGQRIGVGGGP